ncbi:hypothetical protein Sru01_69630 [Sphaerisporangium rufum]|uniref:DUF397 domain-containing protein n=1 Tax=Sphaerisporangium rufum TaxID=1381558 RepID=A0A919R985_9ACTN|nr:DUF397 domain-containing protein [Sphaerisporangium rufum]GII81981.1 hypothetical protein Sru01_69630 [Sphaerisporangium rufum]
MDLPGNLQWRKASASSADGSNCVEVTNLSSGGRAVRDSKNPAGPMLICTAGEWAAFLEGTKHGRFGT